MADDILYKIALSMIPGIGGVLARNLVAYTGNAESVFNEPLKNLVKIPGIGEVNASRIKEKSILIKAEKEVEFVERNQISVHFYTDKNYPRRLKNCPDSPVILYSKGNSNPDEQKVISIVGTRNSTEYGKRITEELIGNFASRNHKILIVSGLAYGIDIIAHKAAIKHQLPTIGVLGHGLDKLYPSLHAETARKMLENGGLFTDFPGGTRIDPQNFIRRNRIIAGLADATLVVESAEKGGALITAEIANSYNRDVFAFPGRSDDMYSKGCNQLIRNNNANLIQGIEDIEYFMGWETSDKKIPAQSQLFVELQPDEEKIVSLLRGKREMFIDEISSEMGLPTSRVSALLLNMEFKNILTALPGKMYKLR